MPMITILPSNKTVQSTEGVRLLDAILAAEVPFAHKCGGKADCGSCHVFVHDGRKTLSKIQRLENEKLDSIVGVGSKSRLACQAKVGSENITVELLSFA
ncbi:MAG: 2Fe-2S iron-sulfur cluster-binding protein [Pseudomonadota bacterium]